jgi:hypothetical protein
VDDHAFAHLATFGIFSIYLASHHSSVAKDIMTMFAFVPHGSRFMSEVVFFGGTIDHVVSGAWRAFFRLFSDDSRL